MAEEAPGGNGDGKTPNSAEGPAVIERHASIPESFFDAEAKNYKFEDIGTALSERDTLKTAADERAKLIPAKADDYKFDLGKEFKMPDGFKFVADPKDPMVVSARQLASDLKLTQPEFDRLVQFEAQRQAGEIQRQREFDAAQTKALGANAVQRREAASTWIDGIVKDKGAAAVLKTMLTYTQGVEGIEAIIDATKIGQRGNSNGENLGDAKNAELKEAIGKPGGASKVLAAAFRGK